MNTLYENGFNNDKRRPWSDGKACQGSWREPGGKICPNGGFGTNSSKFLWRPLQLSKKNKSKNCFEILMAKEMELDRAPWNFNFFIFTMYMWQPLVQADTMSYYVRSATRSCVITRGCKANIFRITQWQKKCILCTVTFSILLFIGDACSVQLQSGDSQVVLNTLLGTLWSKSDWEWRRWELLWSRRTPLWSDW